ncbi:hypothetical protein, partial [Rhabdothermincola sp.]|uniref:hypothetical protein n=1 Tax=Rhabdothermincola sp. TaxID=2820405 RepID=UPI002FE26192
MTQPAQESTFRMPSAESSPPRRSPDEPRLSFKEREMLTALRRLANARSQLSQLEEKLAAQQQRDSWDPGDLERVEELQRELDKLRQKAQSRFGGGSARERLAKVELEQRLILDRLGVGSFEDLEALRRSPTSTADEVDPVFVQFARRELAAAEEAYRQVLLLPDDAPAGSESGDEELLGDLPEIPDYPPPIDLTHP